MTRTDAARTPQIRRLPLPIFRRLVVDTWRGTLGWTLGVSAALFLYLPLYPAIGNDQMAAVLDSMPEELIKTLGYENLTTGAGYAQATIFGLIVFALLTIAATAWSSSAIAGAEESGRLELTLAHGVGRIQFALESTLAVVVRLAWLVAYTGAVTALLNEPSELGLELGNIVAACAALLGLTLLTASIGLLAGALTGTRAIATGAAAGVAIAGYVLNAVGNQNADVEWLQRFSPYDWAYGGAPLLNGGDLGGLALLWGIAILAIAGAVIALNRRDVTG